MPLTAIQIRDLAILHMSSFITCWILPKQKVFSLKMILICLISALSSINTASYTIFILPPFFRSEFQLFCLHSYISFVSLPLLCIGVIKKPFKPHKRPTPHQNAPQNTVFNFHGAVAIYFFTNRTVRCGLRFDILLVRFKPHRTAPHYYI